MGTLACLCLSVSGLSLVLCVCWFVYLCLCPAPWEKQWKTNNPLLGIPAMCFPWELNMRAGGPSNFWSVSILALLWPCLFSISACLEWLCEFCAFLRQRQLCKPAADTAGLTCGHRECQCVFSYEMILMKCYAYSQDTQLFFCCCWSYVDFVLKGVCLFSTPLSVMRCCWMCGRYAHKAACLHDPPPPPINVNYTPINSY